MAMVLVIDDGLGKLAPLTDLRAVFDVRTGAFTSLERFARALGFEEAVLRVPEGLAEVTRERHAAGAGGAAEGVRIRGVNDARALAGIGADGVLAVLGRAVGIGLGETPGVIAKLREGEAAAAGDGTIIAARLSASGARAVMEGAAMSGRVVAMVAQAQLLERPWHVRVFRDAALRWDLQELVRERGGPGGQSGAAQVVGTHAVVVAESARVYPGVVIDAESGAVVIGPHAVVRPGAVLTGPVYVGAHSHVLDRAVIRPFTAIGPWCKVAGEIGGTIFQGFANKAHDGYLGDSCVGEWVNLGAGTTNSNLLNTYGEVACVAAPGGSYERTGQQFLGAVIGDHVKTAICTRIMTGAVLHTGSMFAQTAAVSGCVGAFTWATDSGARLFRLDKFLDVARAALARRKAEMTPGLLARLTALHAATHGGRG